MHQLDRMHNHLHYDVCTTRMLQTVNDASSSSHDFYWPGTRPDTKLKQDSLALASMARDDPPASSTAAACVVKWDRNFKPKLAIIHQCTSVTDRRTLAS